MKKPLLLVICTLCFLKINAQQKSILVYDLKNQTIDTIQPEAIDTSITSACTAYNLGDLDSHLELLDENYPTTNTYPNSNFTYKRRAELDFDLENYPIRTSVNTFYFDQGDMKPRCSGSMISQRHVLSAAHCYSEWGGPFFEEDSLFVAPIFNNGLLSKYEGSYVEKIYIFQDWQINGEDISILELEHNLGAETGWLGIGFEDDAEILKEGIFYKFSYPGQTILQIDSNHYNGDTLFYSYGLVDIVTDAHIAIGGTSGIFGESGSSIIKVKNEAQYTTYGVLSYAGNLSHSKITSNQFFAFKNIISDDIVLSNEHFQEEKQQLNIYPNPTSNYLNISIDDQILDLTIYNNFGQTISSDRYDKVKKQLSLQNLATGIYYIKIETETSNYSEKFIKL